MNISNWELKLSHPVHNEHPRLLGYWAVIFLFWTAVFPNGPLRARAVNKKYSSTWHLKSRPPFGRSIKKKSSGRDFKYNTKPEVKTSSTKDGSPTVDKTIWNSRPVLGLLPRAVFGSAGSFRDRH